MLADRKSLVSCLNFSPYLQVSKLDCYCFVDAGTGREPPGSEAQDFMIHRAVDNMSTSMSASATVPTKTVCWGTGGCYAYSGFAWQLKNTELEEPAIL